MKLSDMYVFTVLFLIIDLCNKSCMLSFKDSGAAWPTSK